MAQQFIDFGSFPNDPTADPIRAAFQKIQDNFTDIYNTTSSAGVTTLTAGSGLRQFGGTTGDILIVSNIPSITINTASSLLVGVTAATTNTATITSYTTPFKLDLAPNITTTNANFSGLTRTSNLQVANYVTSALVPNANVTYDLGTSSLRWKDLYLSGSTLYLGAQTIGANASSVNLSSLVVASNITVGNISVSGSIITSVNSSVTTNDVSSNTLTVSKTVSSSLRPTLTGVYTLGNSTYSWKSLSVTDSVAIANTSITANTNGVRLPGITYTSNLIASNATLGNATTSNYFIGNAAFLTNIPSGNISGQVANALVAGTVYSGLQPNIVSLGTLTSLIVSGNIDSLSNLNAANLKADSFLGNFLPYGNETQDLGSPTRRWKDLWLSGNTLRIGGTSISANSNTTTISGSVVTTSLEAGTITAVYLGGTLTTTNQPNITGVGILDNLNVSGNLLTGEISVTGNLQAANISTTGSISAPTFVGNVVTPEGGVVAAPGNSTQLLFNDGGNTSAVPGMTFDKTASLLTIQGNVAGGNLTSSGGLSVSGNASIGNVSTAGINATGNVNSGNVISLGIISATGNLVGGNVVTNGFLQVTGNASIGSITTTTLSGEVVSVSGNVSGANLVASGILKVDGQANVGSLTTSGIVSAATLAATNANITGALTANSLTSNGEISGASLFASGGLTVTGDASIGNLTTTNVNGQLVYALGNITGGNLITSGIISAGVANVANLNTSIVTSSLIQASGNVSGGNLIANGILSVSGTASAGNVTSNGNITANGTITGNTFVATLFSGNGASITFVNGANIAGAVGLASNATFAFDAANATYSLTAGSATTATTASSATTVSGSSQPSITSVGTLTGLTVSGAFSGVNVSASGYMLSSVGTGIAATGTTQAGAALLSKQVNVVSTVTTGSQDGVRLPGATVGMQIIIINTSASACKVYPASGAKIDTLATDASFSLGAGSRLMIIASSTSQWYTMVGVYG